jgi:hypothetical protein
MKTLCSLSASAVLAFYVIAGFTSCRTPDRNTRAHLSSSSTAPTGLYTLATDLGYRYFTISLQDTGDYQVTSELLGFTKSSQTQKGRWTWNNLRHEFLLTPDPASENLGYEFRHLQVDDQNPETLKWLPLNEPASRDAASDYIRFRLSH